MLAVHLDGYLNVLGAALPIMAAAGHGRILGVTSGLGVASRPTPAPTAAPSGPSPSLTWQLGAAGAAGRDGQRHVAHRRHPDGHRRARARAAARRAAASGRRPPAGSRSARCRAPRSSGRSAPTSSVTGSRWCSGQVIFAGGSEVAVVDEPRLLEVVRTDARRLAGRACSRPSPPARSRRPRPARRAAAAATPGSGRSSTSRPPPSCRRRRVRSCAVVTDRPELAAALTAALEAAACRAPSCRRDAVATASAARPTRCAAAVDATGPIDAVVVALAGSVSRRRSATAWERVLAEHAGIVEHIHADAGWARAAADYAAERRPSGPAGDAHRRHHRRRSQPGPGLGAARPGRPRRDRASASRPSRSASRAPAADGGRPVGELVGPPARAAPRRRRWPAPSWWSAPAGSACAATRARAAASPSAAPTSPTGSTTRSGSIVGATPSTADGGADDRPQPTRVVDAHVHLWDPARTDWYPYLSGRQQLELGDVTGMSRRFDVATYRAESAGWNVEKLVNVAAATGRHSIDETIELDRAAPTPTVIPTPSSAASRRPTRWPRPSS